MRTLFTIGYEGKTQAEFLQELQAAGVDLVIDVRAVAASRRPGFSKTALANGLRECGIEYLHLRPLGTPAAGREAALALEQALDEASRRPAALLCYEREAPDCHRSMLAKRMVERIPFDVRDL